MVLQPLEFSECLVDSPHFREKLFNHEKELERMSKDLKGLIAECKGLIDATTALSKAQRHFSETLMNFKFETIGAEETDEEKIIGNSLKNIGQLISAIEDERDRMIERSYRTIIEPLEKFRKEKIGTVKEGKKKFEKQTAKFCQSLERYLGLKAKSNDTVLKEEDARVEMEKRHFYQASMEYVKLLQDIQERKKFEFVEIMILFINSWLTFYHQGHEVADEYKKDILQDIQLKIQKCRDNFESTNEQTEALMKKTLEIRGSKGTEMNPHPPRTSCTREGYLYVMEKKALGTNWIKSYCTYTKETKEFCMIPFNPSFQLATNKAFPQLEPEKCVVTSCTRRATDSIEKRFCFDITAADRSQPITLQATSDEDRKIWMDAMDGKEPIYAEPTKSTESDNILLDDVGNKFILKCLNTIESRGLEEQGLYRIVGVQSKVSKLLSIGLDPKKVDKLVMDDEEEWEIKTITSAIKNYLRSLPEPLLTFSLHQQFIAAAKQETKTLRINYIHELVHQLPYGNFETLKHLIYHLKKVSEHSELNLMTVQNLSVCFGPTIMKPPEETVAAIMNIKFCNLVVEILITYCDQIFESAPDGVDISNTHVVSSKPTQPDNSSPGAIGKTANVSSPKPNHKLANMLPAVITRAPAVTRPERPQRPTTCAVGVVLPHNDNVTGDKPVLSAFSNVKNERPTANTRSNMFKPVLPDKVPMKEQRQMVMHDTVKPSGIATANVSNINIDNVAPSSGNIPIIRTHSMPASELNVHARRLVNGNRTTTANGGDNKPNQTPLQKLQARASPLNRHTVLTDGSGGSSESINSRSSSATHGSGEQMMTTSVDLSHSLGGSVQRALHKFAHYHTTKPSGGRHKHMKRKSADSVCFFSSNNSSNNSRVPVARTLYACQAEHPSELSFEANQFVYNVRDSSEPGWLDGTIDGHTGLIPANYIEYIDCSPASVR